MPTRRSARRREKHSQTCAADLANKYVTQETVGHDRPLTDQRGARGMLDGACLVPDITWTEARAPRVASAVEAMIGIPS